MDDPDPFAWLEDVEGARALAWAKEQNAKTLPELQSRPEYKAVYDKALSILDSKDKIPVPSLYGTTVYNLQVLNPQIWNPNWIFAGMLIRVQ